MAAAVDVLVVDDNDALLDLATRALRKAGFTVAAAKSWAELESLLPDLQAQLILMDVQMPELFGDDIAAVLRHERSIQTPIYLFSTLPVAELKRRAADAKIDGYISKESGMKNLLSEVHKILGTG